MPISSGKVMILCWVFILFVLKCDGAQQISPSNALEANIRATMNASVDPCADFYEFACGGWLTSSNASMSSTKNKVAKSFTAASDNNQAILFNLIRNNATDQRVRVFTQSCMNLSAIEEHNLESNSFMRLIRAVDVVESTHDVMRTAGLLRRINSPFVIASEVVVDSSNPERYIVSLRPAGLIMKNPNIYKSDKNAKLMEYKNHVQNMLSIFGDDNAEISAEEIVAFERQMLSSRTIKGRSSQSNMSSVEKSMPLSDLVKLTGLNWDEYLGGAGIVMTGDTIVSLKYPDVIKKMAIVVQSTAISTLKSYLKWALISVMSPFLPELIRQADFDFFQKRLLGKQKPQLRWRYCTDLADQYLSELTGPAFVKNEFPETAKSQVKDILNRSMTAFADQFQKLEWMDQATIDQAVDKLRRMKALIGYPDTWDTKRYEKIQFDSNLPFAELIIQVKTNEWMRSVELLNGPVDRERWTKPVTTVNAYYTPTLNAITFPAGILQKPFYSAAYPITMNFGGIGFIMTHELVHGFDDKGRQYNQLGGLKQWWPEHVLKAYKERVQCYRRQYSQMRDNDPVSGNLTVNSNQTMGENIADNGAVDIGLRALKLYLEQNPTPDPILSDFTLDQTYFLTVGQMFCSRMRPELARLLQATNPHPPSRIRINAIMANSKLFSQAYQCPSGSPMNPVRKCDLWRSRLQDECPTTA